MRRSVWTALLLTASVQAQETVTVCDSYSVIGVSTFTEYVTYFVTPGGTLLTRPSTTIGGSGTTLRSLGTSTQSSITPVGASSSSSALTSRTGSASGGTGATGSTRSFLKSSTTQTLLLPDDVGDPVTPNTPIPTSSKPTTSTLSETTTITGTNPTATDSNFVIAFNLPQANPPILVKRASFRYLAFDQVRRSILFTSAQGAARFNLVNDTLRSGAEYVTIDNISKPTRFLLQAEQPPKAVGINIDTNGAVVFPGIDGFCSLNGSLVVIEQGQETPIECRVVTPELLTPDEMSSISTSSTNNVSSTTIGVQPTALTTSASRTTSTTFAAATSTPSSNSEVTLVTSSPSSGAITSSTTLTGIPTSSSSSVSSTSPANSAVVTNKAYIDTVLRHHNRHRANHTADPLTWNADLAATSKKIADTCVYEHVIDTDCPTAPDEFCYGQNIGAGYLSTQMGAIISDGFYNGEVNYYTYYGGEPDTSTLHEWGHFSQIVWKGSSSVGCYTTNCSESGLGNVNPNTNIRPFFTVCNYGPPGNYLDEFADNVIAPLNYPTVTANYLCPSDENCEDAGGLEVEIMVP